ncbi:hypothetical protein F2P81_020592 [Scophthalmus maximus]|uniref:Uncharacterized protein n=1 Tax=Scophthalmus maximus TaxID=52904 RepID=A0A6A4S9S5_SCOMX|nr:hypothetical protein F2P81_020592 [Scophthalmus maximus]
MLKPLSAATTSGERYEWRCSRVFPPPASVRSIVSCCVLTLASNREASLPTNHPGTRLGGFKRAALTGSWFTGCGGPDVDVSDGDRVRESSCRSWRHTDGGGSHHDVIHPAEDQQRRVSPSQPRQRQQDIRSGLSQLNQ